mgnify:CR=1 FL=1
MEKLEGYIARFAESAGHNWDADGMRLVMPVGQGGRHQDIKVERIGEDYVMTSVVLGTAQVTRSSKTWRVLAKLAWHRNADNEIVTFAFDRRDRLVGQVRHPAAHLDYEEFELYAEVLARECDRFEYVLSGGDRF